jgi:hypothetical protein
MKEFRKIEQDMPEEMKVERVMIDVRSNMKEEMDAFIEEFRVHMGYKKHDDLFDSLFDDSDEAVIMDTMRHLVSIATRNVTEGLIHYRDETCEPFDR